MLCFQDKTLVIDLFSVWISKERVTKVAYFLCQTKLLKINPRVIDKCTVYWAKIISPWSWYRRLDAHSHLSEAQLRGNILLSDNLLFRIVGPSRVCRFSETLERLPKIIFSRGVLPDCTQTEVGWGHMQMQWGTQRMERRWKGIMQGWITVDTRATESLWMHESLKCIKLWSGL